MTAPNPVPTPAPKLAPKPTSKPAVKTASKTSVFSKGCGCFFGVLISPILIALILSGIFFLFMPDWIQISQRPPNQKFQILPPSNSDKLSLEEKLSVAFPSDASFSETLTLSYGELNGLLGSLKSDPCRGLIIDKMAFFYEEGKVFFFANASGFFQPQLYILLELVNSTTSLSYPPKLVSGKLNSLSISEGWRLSALQKYYLDQVATMTESAFAAKPFFPKEIEFASSGVKIKLSSKIKSGGKK
ncbi:MAG: hypothetical protein HQM08_02990 [Candidatus Riflebacteria bacterium]|nr:hypothetical protein [Candidatus Riflebacteria bacterium]